MLPNASIVCTADERKIFDTLLDVVKVYELPVTLRVAGKGLSHLPHSASLIAHTRLTFVFYNLRRVGAGQASREKLVGHRHRAGYVYGPGFREQGERVLGHERRGNQGGWGDSKQPVAEPALGNGDDARARELACLGELATRIVLVVDPHSVRAVRPAHVMARPPGFTNLVRSVFDSGSTSTSGEHLFHRELSS